MTTTATPRKALVLGASGTLGQALCGYLPAAGWQVEALDRKDGDLTDAAMITRILGALRPDVVFNAGAYTNVDRAEDEPDLAFAVNAAAPETLARATTEAGAKLVHYSTDFVFDGEKESPYDETDPPSPQGVYARSKLAGEQRAAAVARQLFILRVGCLYGHGGRNFPSTILGRLRAGETVRADALRAGSPTWVRNVAQVSAALAATDHFGLYHCTSHGETTWADYARFIANEIGVPESRVQALPTGLLPTKAPRPRRAILENQALAKLGLDTMPDWRSAARAFIGDEAQVV